MNLAELKLKPYARLAAMGALGVSVGAMALYLLIVFGSRPIRAVPISCTPLPMPPM